MVGAAAQWREQVSDEELGPDRARRCGSREHRPLESPSIQFLWFFTQPQVIGWMAVVGPSSLPVVPLSLPAGQNSRV